MTTDLPHSERAVVDLGVKPADTCLPAEPEELLRLVDEACAAPPDRRRDAVADLARAFPASLAVWALLGELARDDVEAYACFRVGYHRGLDALRKAGWKGSGLVRWAHAENRPFLRCLDGLREAAAVIGEQAEVERCDVFLHQLDPAWERGPVTGRWWSPGGPAGAPPA